jgi:hypothetical protein
MADLPKYRKMYRNQPDIQQAVQMQVNLAIGKGFTISHEDQDVIDYLNKVSKQIALPAHMLTMATDMLVYGDSFTEIQWNRTVKTGEQLYQYEGMQYLKSDLEKMDIPFKSVKKASIEPPIYNFEKDTLSYSPKRNFIAQVNRKSPDATSIVGLKDLDPLYMRTRRDSWGNEFGYIQWMAFPPVLIDNESLIHIKYRPTSTGYESAYGYSLLMPIIKNNDLLTQFENDASVWIHSKAVPPLIIKGGTPEKPYSTNQMIDLISALKSRTAATMMFTKGDVTIEEFKTIASELRIDWWLDYLLLRRYQALSVPPILMGYVKYGARGIGEVVLHDFMARLQILQEFISDPIEDYIFGPLIRAKFGEDVENAEIVWKPIIEEDKNMRSQRLIQMLQTGAVSVNEVREEMGFQKRSEDDEKDMDEFDKLVPMQSPMGAKGFPPGSGGGGAAPALQQQQKPGQPEQPQRPQTEVSRPVQQEKKPPESHMKLETGKQKKFQLMKLEETFREKMLELTQKTKFDLRDGSKLVKQIKKEAKDSAQSLINEYIVASYLVGRMKANGALGKEDDLSLKQEDLGNLTSLKDKCLEDFSKIVGDMVKDREDGKLV